MEDYPFSAQAPETMQQLDLPPAPSRGVHAYLLGDELLLFAEHHGAVFRLNTSAALVWSCLEEGLDHASIVDELVQTFNIPAAQAERDLEAALEHWLRHGLIGDRKTPPQAVAAGQETSADVARIPRPSVVVTDYPWERSYRMLETVVRIRFSRPGLVRIADSAFAHLRVAGDSAACLTIDVQHDVRGFFLFFNGEAGDYCASAEELAPLLHGKVVSEAYAAADYLIAIHAAAVGNGEACVVFPACSGAGKSTLTAALIASGFQYGTDELVLLKHSHHSVQTIPAGIATKAGAWPVLAPYHRQLQALPVGLRRDGQHVRYLLPRPQALPANTARSWPVAALVFPAYRPGHNATLARISPADALCRLAEAGYNIDGGLNRESIAGLIDWIGGVSCYELHYGDLQDAISRVDELLTAWRPNSD